MQIKNIIIIIAAFLHCSFVFALDFTPDGIYEATKDACRKISENSFNHYSPELDLLRAGIYPSKKYNAILDAIRSQSINESLDEMRYRELSNFAQIVLESSEFSQALEECYPDSLQARNYFIEGIKRADRNGKVASAVIAISLVKSIGVGGKLIGSTVARASKLGFFLLNKFQDGAYVLTGLSLLNSDSGELNSQKINLDKIIDNKIAEKKVPDQDSLFVMKNYFQDEVKHLEIKLQNEKNPRIKEELKNKIKNIQRLILEIEKN